MSHIETSEEHFIYENQMKTLEWTGNSPDLNQFVGHDFSWFKIDTETLKSSNTFHNVSRYEYMLG